MHMIVLQTVKMAPDQAMAARLRKAREMAGFKTAAEAARALRIAYPTYAAHEGGERGFARQVVRYAGFFKVDYRWLYTGVGKPKGPTIEADIMALSEREQQQIIEMIDFFKSRRKTAN